MYKVIGINKQGEQKYFGPPFEKVSEAGDFALIESSKYDNFDITFEVVEM